MIQTLRDVLTALSTEQDIILRDTAGATWDPWDYMADADDSELDHEATIMIRHTGREVRLCDAGYVRGNCEPMFWVVPEEACASWRASQ